MAPHDYVVIGGGIVGLSTAYHLSTSRPGARILLLEKESDLGRHQTGRNSGVIHSGIYYQPGSFKATFARSGARSMVAFCKEHDIAHEVCGKVIVATSESEIPRLENLYQRGLKNDVPVERVSAERVREIEPHVRCVAGVLVKSTGITSYVAVCRKLLELLEKAGGEVRFEQPVRRIETRSGLKVVGTDSAEFEAKFVINCAGL